MSIVSRVTSKTYFNTGDQPTEAQFGNTLDSVPFYDDLTFTDLPGTTWDGSYKTKTLSSNTALTLSTSKKIGVLIVKQDGTGSRTLSIGGVSVPINSAANSKTVIEAIAQETDSTYVIVYHTNVVGVTGGDVTAPTVTALSVENATPTKINVTFSEAMDTSGSTASTGDFSVKINAINQTVSGWAFTSSTTAQATISPAVVNGDVVLFSFSGGSNKLQDAAGNDLAAFTDSAVTNNVAAGGGGVTWATLPWFVRHKVATLGTTANQISHNVGGTDFIQTLKDISGTAGHSYPSVYDLVTPGGSTEEPILLASGIDSQPAIDINSPSGNQIYNNGPYSPLLSFPATRAAVVRFPTIPIANKYFLYNVASGSLLDAAILGASSGNLFVYAGGGIIDTGFAPAANTTYLVWIERDLDKTTRVYVNNSLKTTVADTGHTQFSGEKLGDAANGCRFYYADGGVIASVVSSSDRTAAYNDLKTTFTSLP